MGMSRRKCRCILGSVGQCASHPLDTIKQLDFPGKKFYNQHRNKIDTVADVIITKDGDDKDKQPKKNTSASSTISNTNSVKAKKVGIVMGLKLYHVSDSPPCLAVRMGLKYLNLQCELVDVDFLKAEQASELYKKKNPQGEVPLLDDNGFLLSESIAILQYLADRYKVDDKFYPMEPQLRAVINHRLAFHLSTYYSSIAHYVLLPICYAYSRSEEGLKKVKNALQIFQEILTRQEGSYVAGEEITIADLPLVMGTVLLEVIEFDLSSYPKVKAWYEGFKGNQPELWVLAEQGLKELQEFEKNPPDLSQIHHPLHATDRSAMQIISTAVAPAEDVPSAPSPPQE